MVSWKEWAKLHAPPLHLTQPPRVRIRGALRDGSVSARDQSGRIFLSANPRVQTVRGSHAALTWGHRRPLVSHVQVWDVVLARSVFPVDPSRHEAGEEKSYKNKSGLINTLICSDLLKIINNLGAVKKHTVEFMSWKSYIYSFKMCNFIDSSGKRKKTTQAWSKDLWPLVLARL